FVLGTPGGKHLVMDPWLEQNPKCPPDRKRVAKADAILVSHGHSDHASDVVPVARATGAPVVAIYELAQWFEGKGLQNVIGMSIGGPVQIAGLEVSMVPAIHSSSTVDEGRTVYLGEPAGFVVKLENGQVFYFAGDTALFGDMRLIAEMYQPEIAFLPIGGHFTMDTQAAARACRLLGVRQVVPRAYWRPPRRPSSPHELRTPSVA